MAECHRVIVPPKAGRDLLRGASLLLKYCAFNFLMCAPERTPHALGLSRCSSSAFWSQHERPFLRGPSECTSPLFPKLSVILVFLFITVLTSKILSCILLLTYHHLSPLAQKPLWRYLAGPLYIFFEGRKEERNKGKMEGREGGKKERRLALWLWSIHSCL